MPLSPPTITSAYPARAVANVDRHFYFLQDHEPGFSPSGYSALFAQATYSFGFDALSNGDWLHELAQSYGMWSVKWEQAADPDHYFCVEPENRLPGHIAFYARQETSRRAVELRIPRIRASRARRCRLPRRSLWQQLRADKPAISVHSSRRALCRRIGEALSARLDRDGILGHQLFHHSTRDDGLRFARRRTELRKFAPVFRKWRGRSSRSVAGECRSAFEDTIVGSPQT